MIRSVTVQNMVKEEDGQQRLPSCIRVPSRDQ